MAELTPDFNEDEFTIEPARRPQRQLSGRITGQPRNRDVAPNGVVYGRAPNRKDRRWYQKNVTARGGRLHHVLLGGWRKHDTRQQIRTRIELARGLNAPVDGLTRRERRAEHALTYRAWRKSHSRRITPER
jgi:hypothetical protein